MEHSLVINYALVQEEFLPEEENPCVSISEDLSDTDTDCGGGASGILAAMINWVSGGDLSTVDTSGDNTRVYSSALVVQDLTGNGYELKAVGSELGERKIEEREQTKTVKITPADADAENFVDLSAMLDPIPDTILSVSKSSKKALDEEFNEIYGFSWVRSGDGVTVSQKAYASFSVRYLATVDTYDYKDSGEGGYKSIVYSVGACGRIDGLDMTASGCFMDSYYDKYGYPWENDSDSSVIINDPEPEAEQQNATIIYHFCTKELIYCSPEGIVPDGSCWGGRRWPSGEKCESCEGCA